MNKQDRDKILAWVAKVGLNEARKALYDEGISYTTAVFLTKGTYPSEMKARIRMMLEKAMSKKRSA